MGVADVSREGHAWPAKTVKGQRSDPRKGTARLISGRNNPGCSIGLEEPLKNPQATGRAVIEILNTRIDHALEEFTDLRLLVFVRDMANLRFCIFEKELARFSADGFQWELNKRSNLVGRDPEGIHRLTWQRHGSQLTVLHAIPDTARVFTVRRPRPVDRDAILASVGYAEDWVSILED